MVATTIEVAITQRLLIATIITGAAITQFLLIITIAGIIIILLLLITIETTAVIAAQQLLRTEITAVAQQLPRAEITTHLILLRVQIRVREVAVHIQPQAQVRVQGVVAAHQALRQVALRQAVHLQEVAVAAAEEEDKFLCCDIGNRLISQHYINLKKQSIS